MKELNENDRIVSKTDKTGRITYVNERFMEICGYSKKELIGQPHNIIRHPDMPKAAFEYMWNEIKADREIFVFVINLTKDGDYYWVLANIIPTEEDTYTSFRVRSNPEAITIIKDLYAEMLRVERSKGVNESMKVLLDLLKENEITYSELISNLQTKGTVK